MNKYIVYEQCTGQIDNISRSCLRYLNYNQTLIVKALAFFVCILLIGFIFKVVLEIYEKLKEKPE